MASAPNPPTASDLAQSDAIGTGGQASDGLRHSSPPAEWIQLIKDCRDAFDHVAHMRPVQSQLCESEQVILNRFREQHGLKSFTGCTLDEILEADKSRDSAAHSLEKLKVADLRKRVADLKLPDNTDDHIRAYLDSDFNLLRMLRARNLDLDKAFRLLEGAIAWRGNARPHEMKCASCVSTIERCLKSPKLLYSDECCSDMRFIGYDPAHRPVLYCSFRHTKHRGVQQTIEHTCAALERAVAVMHKGSPGDVIVVNNFNGFSFSDLNPLVGVRAIQVFSDFYPETLKMMIVVDPPRIFWPLFHRILKPLLAKETAAKALFLDSRTADGGRAVLAEHFFDDMTDWLVHRIKNDH